jgi:hypothetical protein
MVSGEWWKGFCSKFFKIQIFYFITPSEALHPEFATEHDVVYKSNYIIYRSRFDTAFRFSTILIINEQIMDVDSQRTGRQFYNKKNVLSNNYHSTKMRELVIVVPCRIEK